jgi:hypothetical protein
MTALTIPKKVNLIDKFKKWFKKLPQPDPLDTCLILFIFCLSLYRGSHLFDKEYLLINLLVWYTLPDLIVLSAVMYTGRKLLEKDYTLFCISLQIAKTIGLFLGMLLIHRVLVLNLITDALPIIMICVTQDLIDKFKRKP